MGNLSNGPIPIPRVPFDREPGFEVSISKFSQTTVGDRRKCQRITFENKLAAVDWVMP